MKINRIISKSKLLTTILYLLYCSHAFSQFSVSGKILDEQRRHFPLVNVAFLNRNDSMLITGTVSDSTGFYHQNLKSGEYIVRYSFLGYRTLFKDLHLDNDIQLDDIQMETEGINLKEITVSARSNPFQISEGGLKVDVEHSILQKQNNIYDLLSKIPGILKHGTTIEVIGRGQPIYYINGRKITEIAELENIEISHIKSIQLITDSNVRFHSENRAVIDIKIKSPDEGFAFSTQNGITKGKHFSGENHVNLSYNKKNISFYTSYSYQKQKKEEFTQLEQQNRGDTIWNITENIIPIKSLKGHNYTGGMTLRFNSTSEIGIKYAGRYTENLNHTTDSLTMMSNKGISDKLNITNSISMKNTTHHINLYYSANFKNNWDLNFYADYIHKIDKKNGCTEETSNVQKNETTNYNGKASWEVFATNFQILHNMGKFGKIELGYDFSQTNGKDYINYKRALNNGHTQNNEIKNSAFVLYNIGLKNFNISSGLRYENIYTELKENLLGEIYHKTYHNVIPSINISYHSNNIQQNFSYSIYTERPPFSLMNNNAVYVNKYTYQKGNIKLKQAKSNSFNYMFMYKYLFMNINYTNTKQPLVTAFYCMPENSSVTVSYMDNFKRLQNLTGMVNIQYPIKNWLPSFTLTCMKSFFHYPGYQETLKAKRPLTILNIDNNFTLPLNFLASINLTYAWKGDYQIIRIKNYSSLNLSLKKSFLKEQLQVSFDWHDIFNQDKNRCITQLNDIMMYTHNTNDTRKIGLSVTYRFRNNKEMKNRSAAQTEMSRLDMK